MDETLLKVARDKAITIDTQFGIVRDLLIELESKYAGDHSLLVTEIFRKIDVEMEESASLLEFLIDILSCAGATTCEERIRPYC